MDDDQQQAQQLFQMPYMSPSPSEGSSFEKLTDPEQQLDQMALNFKNMDIDEFGKLKSCGDPLANDAGINFAVGQGRSAISRITILSNLTKQDIQMVGNYLSVNLLRTLMVSRIPFQMKNFSARSTIASTVLITAFTTMKRAEVEGLSDKKIWRGGVQEMHQNIHTDSGKKGGWLGSLWKKN